MNRCQFSKRSSAIWQSRLNLSKTGFQPEYIQQEMLWLDIVRLFKIINIKN